MARTSVEWREQLRGMAVVEVRRTKDGKGGRKDGRSSRGALWVIGIAEERILGGLAKGASDYLGRRGRSARRKKDGAVRDLARNISRSQETVVKQLAKIPSDLVDSRMLSRPGRAIFRLTRVVSI